ncbi:hypothetical protein BDQ17DRAFT_1426581 [Cyathus striatus]|nr:hypothetical protein BDQ17DRAFT_1426581 [Cyathus striatus]
MSILTKVITTLSGLEVVSEGGNSTVPIATGLSTALDEEMGKDMGKDIDVNSEEGNDMLPTATTPKAVSEVAMGKFLPNLDIDSEGGNKELPTTTISNVASEAALGKFLPNFDADSKGGNTKLPTATVSDADIGKDIIIDSEAEDNLLSSTIAANTVEEGNMELPITSALDTDIDKNIIIDSKAEDNLLSSTIAANTALKAAMSKFLHNLDIDSEGGNKEDLVIDSEAKNNFLPTTIAANAVSEAAMGKFLHNLDVHSTIPTATALTAPITTDPIARSIFQEGNIPKVCQTLASNYILDALAKLKATSHKYFIEEGLYISPWNDGNCDPIPYSYETGYSKNRSTFVNTAPSDFYLFFVVPVL